MTRTAKLAVPLLILLGALLAPAGARGDGLPVINLNTNRIGVTSPDEKTAYFAQPEGKGTTVTRVTLSGTGERLDDLVLRGTLAVPGVAWDATTSGLSADGQTLVLIEPRTAFPRRDTGFAVIDAERMRLLERFTLRGDFSFDAISPDGSVIYLIEYVDRRDPTAYQLRAYDLGPGRLRPEPIVDSATAELTMRGFPQTRTTSADGRWEYTLYDGGGDVPFVHALDTVEGKSVCVALQHLAGRGNFWSMRLDLDGSVLSVIKQRPKRGDEVELATVDTEAWTVEDPRSATPVEATSDADGGWLPSAHLLVGFGLVALGLGALMLALRTLRRRSLARRMPADPLPPAERYIARDGDGHARREEEPLRS